MSAPPFHLALRVVPNASKNEVAGWLGDSLKVKIQSPPADGRANEALIEFLAAHFGVPKRSIGLVQGEKSRQKTIRITGADPAALAARLPPRG